MLLTRKTDGLYLLGLGAIILCFGFLFGEPTNNHYAMLNFLPQYWWVLLFGVYGVLKFVSVTISCCKKLCFANSFLGLLLWSSVFSSFVLYDKTPVSPTELLMVLFVMLEAWIFVSKINDKT